MTQQGQFEADFLAAFPGYEAHAKACSVTGNYPSIQATMANRVWLQQAKRHEAELANVHGETYDGRIKTYPMVEMGHGLVSVAESEIDGTKAVIFLKLPEHVPIGEVIPPPADKTHFDVEQIAAAVTFANVAGLNVLIDTLLGLRETITGGKVAVQEQPK